MNRLQGKVALITGAARGQGRSHAVALAAEGADIIALDHCAPVPTVTYPQASKDDLAETERLVNDLDRRCLSRIVDVRDYPALQQGVADALAEFGRLDAVVANAGILSSAPEGDVDLDAWDDVIAINLSGVYKTCKAARAHLQAGASIINVASTAGLKAFEGLPHYVAAKHGVVGLTKALAKDLAPRRIRVNAVAPTNCDTDMIQNEAMYKLFLPNSQAPTRADFERPSRDMQTFPEPWVTPDDVSRAVVYLASDEARHVTGVVLPVDLGALLK
jgi:SDR family mycofactocin-dependent oxidoreductase